jgi:hypothetical protein
MLYVRSYIVGANYPRLVYKNRPITEASARTAICTRHGIFPRKRIKLEKGNMQKTSSNIVGQSNLTKKQRMRLSYTGRCVQCGLYTFPGYKETPLRAIAHN